MTLKSRVDPSSGLGECRFVADLDGKLNSALVRVMGAGTVNEESGLTIGSYECDLGDPGIDLRLLSICLITGYPNVCAEVDDTRNPFRGSPYDYHRLVRFSTGEKFEIVVKVQWIEGVLNSQFTVNGTVPVRELGAPQNLIEDWRPSTSGVIEGAFRFGWTASHNAVTEATAQSRYVIGDRGTLPTRLVRELTIDAVASGSRLSLEQRSRLMNTP